MRVLKVPFYACLTTLTQFMMTEAGLGNLDSRYDEGVVGLLYFPAAFSFTGQERYSPRYLVPGTDEFLSPFPKYR